MTRFELYHVKQKKISWKGPFLTIMIGLFITAGSFLFIHYYKSSIKIEAPAENLGAKVVIHLPNGQEVFTYEGLIFEENGKTYYKGERNTIDLTGGKVIYENWE